MRFFAAILALLVASAPLGAQPAAPAEPPIVAEARAFMTAYADAPGARLALRSDVCPWNVRVGANSPNL